MKIIDLRSDTVTLPSPAMRQAIAEARLGDDVFGEDPTVNALEKKAADMLGKQAGLLVVSGTMGNLVSILTHCGRGDEIILGDQAHTFVYEVGGISALGGIFPHILPNQPDGTLNLSDITAAIRPDALHFPTTRLICLENTHNRCFGTPLKPKYMDDVAEIAVKNNIKIHLDGARIFNAAVSLGVDVKSLVKKADSVMFCLSKGLACPVGSIICGSEQFIQKARKIRKMVGGGMRQAGIIAAAGIVAIDQMVDRLADDHKNAQRLAQGISQIDGLSIEPAKVQSNILYFSLADERINQGKFLEEVAEKGIRFLSTAKSTFRMVTHYGIEADDIEQAISVMSSTMKKLHRQ
jgi:threonine aldolase